MNKRIKKKRSRLKPLKIGDNVYTREYIRDLNKACIGNMNILYLYHQIKELKLTRPRVKSLINTYTRIGCTCGSNLTSILSLQDDYNV